MLRGIAFMIPNEYGFILNALFKVISAEQYLWHFTGWMIEGGLQTDRFESMEWCDGENLLALTAQKPEYYPIDMTWAAFDPTEERVREDSFPFDSYKAYYNSSVRLYLEIVDAEFVRFYAKDAALVEKMLLFCQENRYSDMVRITEENDTFWPECYRKPRKDKGTVPLP